MSYDLSTERTVINTLPELLLYIRAHSALKQRAVPAQQCLACNDANCNVDSLVRSCQCLDSPCEGHECQCRPHPLCTNCLAQLLWTATNSAQQQRGQFRAKCPTCRAEFCPHDLVLYNMDEYADRYYETTLKCLALNMPDLFNIDLSHHDLTQDKLARLADALALNTHLQAIDLFANSAHLQQFHGWRKLGQALARLPKLVDIDVGNCQLGDTGLHAFLGALASGTDHVLDPASHVLDPASHVLDGASHVLDGASHVATLTCLDVSNNALTDAAAPLVARVLRACAALEEVALHTNAWTDHVVPLLGAAMRDKPQLRKVWLHKSALSSGGVSALRAMLDEHVVLVA